MNTCEVCGNDYDNPSNWLPTEFLIISIVLNAPFTRWLLNASIVDAESSGMAWKRAGATIVALTARMKRESKRSMIAPEKLHVCFA